MILFLLYRRYFLLCLKVLQNSRATAPPPPFLIFALLTGDSGGVWHIEVDGAELDEEVFIVETLPGDNAHADGELAPDFAPLSVIITRTATLTLLQVPRKHLSSSTVVHLVRS